MMITIGNDQVFTVTVRTEVMANAIANKCTELGWYRVKVWHTTPNTWLIEAFSWQACAYHTVRVGAQALERQGKTMGKRKSSKGTVEGVVVDSTTSNAVVARASLQAKAMEITTSAIDTAKAIISKGEHTLASLPKRHSSMVLYSAACGLAGVDSNQWHSNVGDMVAKALLDLGIDAKHMPACVAGKATIDLCIGEATTNKQGVLGMHKYTGGWVRLAYIGEGSKSIAAQKCAADCAVKYATLADTAKTYMQQYVSVSVQ